jgi:(p)ppGpp synthase/HD superfamily hydrolase
MDSPFVDPYPDIAITTVLAAHSRPTLYQYLTNGPRTFNERVTALARAAHWGQTRRGGSPYLQHPTRVGAEVNLTHGSFGWAVGMLHDAIEDCPAMAHVIQHEMPDEMYQTLMLLTHTKGEPYPAYIQRIKSSGNPVAIAVKIADMKDNYATATEEQKEKYEAVAHILGIEL